MKVIYSGLQNPSRVLVYNTGTGAVLFVRKKPKEADGLGATVGLVAIFKITYHAKKIY